ncbi:MAG: electron transfer flavoprotein subunit alpha/FixB family protein [Clostridia bacterium]|nr:electron transfer flavoprotein subunit alpha/FixB family protein [Clostridia bacterium]
MPIKGSAAGYGVKDNLGRVTELAECYGASIASLRRMTDSALMTYEKQVGLTGRTVAPVVYLAIGISGAVHHIAGMEGSGIVIAINPDKDAPIFEYADYGIVEEF